MLPMENEQFYFDALLKPMWTYVALGISLLAFLLFALRKKKGILFSTSKFFGTTGVRPILIPIGFLFLFLSAIALSIAIGMPVRFSSIEQQYTYGVDIVFVVDVSTSMLAQDLKPDRLEAAKKVVEDFVMRRHGDRFGLVAFAGDAVTLIPVTSDKKLLISWLRDLSPDFMSDGTAIGLGIATAVNRLKESEAQSKVIILLTDGENNTGFINPIDAAQLAKQLGIKIYTIGVGTYGKAPYPVSTPFGTQTVLVEVSINEDLLKEIAEITGGKYYRATDNKTLEKIFEEIDQLEKTKLETHVYRKEEHVPEPFLKLAAVGLLAFFLLYALANPKP